MIIINTVSEGYFSLNGIVYPMIYQPLKQGSDSVAICNFYDTSFQLQSGRPIADFTINGVSGFVNQAEAMNAILEVVYERRGGEGGGNVVGGLKNTVVVKGRTYNFRRNLQNSDVGNVILENDLVVALWFEVDEFWSHAIYKGGNLDVRDSWNVILPYREIELV